jgi:hypothetical protein
MIPTLFGITLHVKRKQRVNYLAKEIKNVGSKLGMLQPDTNS